MKAFYDNKPSIIEAVGNGSFLYRHGIEASRITEQAGEEPREQWSCEEVTVWAPLSSNKILEAVIVEHYSHNKEQKIINEYNAVQLGLVKGKEAEAYISAYKSFLSERAELKHQVETDCAELGIR